MAKAERESRQFRKEAIILLLPLSILIFKREQIQYFLFLTLAVLIYYIFLNYTQKNDFREELYQIEKKHIAELEEKVEERTKEIVRIMNTDMVTGLFNRRFFEDYLLRTCNAVGKHENISLLYIDLNKYRNIKSMYGKYVAETLLKEVGNRIQKAISDLEDKVLAAYGEDVFIITFRNVSNEEALLRISKNIINEASGKFHIDNHMIVATLNIGIASYPTEAKSHEELIKNADIAMMQARKQGYNKISIYNASFGSNIYDRNKIEVKLKKVNFDEEFQLYYQPQVACETGKIIGVEALIRWYTKHGEFIPPNKFIPLAEESGLIVGLGYWIMEQAAKQLALWREQSSNSFRMAINVSVRQLSEPDFRVKLFEILDKYQISSDLFEIEITENIQVEGNSEVDLNLKAIREKGISIAIDDFGTGYSSLYYLKNLPMDRIKIAKELIDDIEKDSYSLAIIKMVIEIAKSRDTKVIAEGVETKEQWECLRTLKCDEIQGYYFAKPMPGDELVSKWLNKESSN
jgi:diguanylate cyclase (GGDEF)-like protein